MDHPAVEAARRQGTPPSLPSETRQISHNHIHSFGRGYAIGIFTMIVIDIVLKFWR